jgi:hypothetical protein
MIRSKCFILFFNIALILWGCKYQLDKESFTEVTPPSGTRDFDINLIPENDTINIFSPTEIVYNLNTFELEIHYAEFILESDTFKIFNNTGSIYVDPLDYIPGYHTLSLKLYTNSGSGSVADQMGFEGYYVEKNWVVTTDYREAPELTPVISTTDDGVLKFSWPKCEQYNFIAYNLHATLEERYINISITDPDKTYYIDSLFVGGDISVCVTCYVENYYSQCESVQQFIETPKLYFEELGLDSLRIYWDMSEYNAKYRLSWGNTNKEYFNNRADTSYTIEQPGLGEYTTFQLCVVSQYTDTWPETYCYVYDTKHYYLGQMICTMWPEFGYNQMEKVFYDNNYSNFECRDNTLSLINSIHIDDLQYEALISCPTNSTKVSTVSQDHFYIYENKQFGSPNIIDLENNGLNHFLLTDNDIIAYSYSGKYIQKDVNTHNNITDIDIPDYPIYSKWACITTSRNGDYACVVTRNGIRLFHIVGGTVNEVFNDTRSYRSAYFNPNNPSQLLLTLNDDNNLEIRNPVDFSLTELIETPTLQVIENIDPETGYILLTDYDKIYILDPSTHEIKFDLICHSWKTRFYNGVLFCVDGYALDISNIVL